MAKETRTEITNSAIPSLSDDALTMRQIPGLSGDDEQTLMKLSDADLRSADLKSSDVKSADTKSAEREALEAFVGQTISDRYVVHELIGAGGMGAVYRGEQVHLRRRCAIKILLPQAARQPDLVLRFEREAIAGAHVVHPNVVGAVDFGKLADGSCFLVLEYVEGTPLEDLMKKGPMPARRALELTREIASALAAVHEKSIVHRDVKPRNILVDTTGHIKLLDFGLAKVNLDLLSSESRNAAPVPALTGQGVVMGTLAYMAPEAVGGMDAVTSRSDLYALGMVMYEMLSGKRPFDEKDAMALFKRLRTGGVPAIRETAPEVDVPAPAEAIVAKLMQVNPANRYPTAKDLIAAIDAALVEIKPAPAAVPEKNIKKVAESAPAEPKKEEAKADEPQKDEAKAEETKQDEPKASKDKSENAPAAATPAKKSALPDKRVLLLGGGGLALVLVIILIVVLRGSSDDEKKKAPLVASVAPVPVQTAPPVIFPTEIDGIDATGWRERMRKAIPKKDWVQASKALLALAKIDPDMVTGSEMRSDVVTIVAGIGFDSNSAESEQVFKVLGNELGSGGLDILFQVLRTRGGSKAAKRANDLLSQPAAMARATPALRVALDLRKAACPDKRNFFARAVEEGDVRALDELLIAQKAPCPSRKDPCCYREDAEMKDTVSKLRTKLGL
ncbi:MAG TPA: serine/threonine-protein kinase [Polyangium sp.]|nr:serine/threonine-protein kinase [Polyangium sp.]